MLYKEVKLAKVIKLAAALREESFEFRVATEKEKFHQNHYYKMTLMEISNKAIQIEKLDDRMTYPVYLLLKYCWNDILEWSKGVLND